VAAALVMVFLKVVNIGAVWTRLSHLDVPLALLCGVTFLSAYVVRAIRWRLFLTASGYRTSVTRVVMIYQVALFVNWLLPVRGGELVKSLLLRRLDNIPISESLSTVAMDKAMDMLPAIALLLILPFMPFHLSQSLWTVFILILIPIVCALGFLALAAWRRQAALRLLSWCIAHLPRVAQRMEPFLARFVDTLLSLVVRPWLLLRAALLTCVALFLDALFCLLAFAAIGSWIPFPIVLFGYTFFNLAFILPTPPGQIGSNEVIGLLIFSGVFGVNRTAVAAMFLFSHPWSALLMVASGLLCLGAMGLNMRSAISLAQTKTSDEPPTIAAQQESELELIPASTLEPLES
jgi:uncharacterized protein (TIRG00374 family)